MPPRTSAEELRQGPGVLEAWDPLNISAPPQYSGPPRPPQHTQEKFKGVPRIKLS